MGAIVSFLDPGRGKDEMIHGIVVGRQLNRNRGMVGENVALRHYQKKSGGPPCFALRFFVRCANLRGRTEWFRQDLTEVGDIPCAQSLLSRLQKNEEEMKKAAEKEKEVPEERQANKMIASQCPPACPVALLVLPPSRLPALILRVLRSASVFRSGEKAPS